MKTCRLPLSQYYLETPVGKLSLTTCENGMHSLSYMDFEVELKSIDSMKKTKLVKWIEQDRKLKEDLNENPDVHALACFQWLVDYFNSSMKASAENLPKFCYMDLNGVQNGEESFTIRVWKELLKIASGRTITYSELAKISGSAKASRAVGAAMKRNPCAILVPCHRVLPSSGTNENPLRKKQKVGEYANGRNKMKQWLIDFEARS